VLTLVVSPYDLHARTPAACSALLLAHRVVTLLPAPLEGVDPETLRTAGEASPVFVRLLESWRWSAPLWRSGALTPMLDEASPLDDVRAAAARVADERRVEPEPTPAAQPDARRARSGLATLVPGSVFEDTKTYLESICHDLAGGGGRPAVSVPVAVGLERFAARTGSALVRGDAISVAGAMEQRRFTPGVRLSTVGLEGVDGSVIAELRERFEPELDALRDAIGPTATWLDPASREARAQQDVAEAANELRRAVAAGGGVPNSPGGRRARGMISIALTLGAASPESALRAAERAAAVFTASRRGRRHAAAPHAGAAADALGAPSASVMRVKRLAWPPTAE
jgi:hypothetical protein